MFQAPLSNGGGKFLELGQPRSARVSRPRRVLDRRYLASCLPLADWRFGYMIAKLMTAVRGLANESFGDMEDEEFLAAIRWRVCSMATKFGWPSVRVR